MKVYVDGATSLSVQFPLRNAFEMDDDNDNFLHPGNAILFNSSIRIDLYAANGGQDEKQGSMSWTLSDFSSANPNYQPFDNDVTGGTGNVSYGIKLKLLASKAS